MVSARLTKINVVTIIIVEIALIISRLTSIYDVTMIMVEITIIIWCDDDYSRNITNNI